MAKLNIVLLEPEIPANTGNIGRTCVATDTKLHLIEPLGFSLSEKALKRAGMDYWKDLDVTTYLDFEDFLEKNPGAIALTRMPRWEKLLCNNEGVEDLYRCAIRGRLLYYVWQGKCRNPGRNPDGT